jgi:ABC-type polysaccharide/polyol phosphate export permease
LIAIGIIILLEFAAFEKKIPEIEWLPADACHLLMALACLWIALALRPLWKKAYALRS